jgi:hypothetical protein
MVANKGKIPLGAGVAVLQNYESYPYTLWEALSEYIDNSIQAYLDEPIVKKKLEKKKDILRISISYNKIKKEIVIKDNSSGITRARLGEALMVGTKLDRVNPGKSMGQFNMGFKSASMWFCEDYTIETKRHDEDIKTIVYVDHANIDQSQPTALMDIEDDVDETKSFGTTFTLNNLKNTFSDANQKKAKDYISSTFRRYIEKGKIEIKCFNEKLEWVPFDLHINPDTGKEYKWIIPSTKLNQSDPESPTVSGWIGILQVGLDAQGNKSKRGSGRERSGINIIRRGRMIYGYPKAYKEGNTFSDATNNMFNQRVVIEIDFDGAIVSHGKNHIDGSQLELLDNCLNAFLIAEGIKSTANAIRDASTSKPPRKSAFETMMKKFRSTNIGQIMLQHIPE